MNLSDKKVIFSLIGIFVIVLILYGRYLNLYFSQDDFFHLKVSQTESLGEFLRLGTFRSLSERGGIYFYRPIFREYLFNIYYSIFGLNAIPFRMTQFLIHFINIALVFKLLATLTKKRLVALVGALFFAIAAANTGIISYLAGGIQVAGALMFYLAASLFFLEYQKTGFPKFKFLTLLFFILALASHEMAITFPAIVAALVILKEGFLIKVTAKVFREVWLFATIAIIYLFLEITIIGLPTGEKQYALNLSPVKLINSYFWYFLWSLGTPEMLLDFVGPGIKLNPNLMRYWGNYYRVIFPTLFLVLSFVLLSFKKLYKDRKYWFFVFWFIVGISPVIFQPSHRLYYYLGTALVGVAGIFGLSYEYFKREILGIAFLLSFVLLTFFSVQLFGTNYWAITRANIAKSLIRDVTIKYPTLPKGASVYYTNDPNHPYLNEEWGNSSKQASVIMSGSDALQLVYKDPTLKVYYEDIERPSQRENVYSLDAIIYR